LLARIDCTVPDLTITTNDCALLIRALTDFPDKQIAESLKSLFSVIANDESKQFQGAE